MTTPAKVAIGLGVAVGAVGLWEGAWWFRRRAVRRALYVEAQSMADALGRPLVVVGAPDQGPTRGPGCGEVTVDLAPSACPNAIQADVTGRLPFHDDSVVVFVSCVLEYVSDFGLALEELRRISGDHLYVTRVEPWTLTAYLYPGARRTIPAEMAA